MEKLASVLKKRTFPFVICHADLHPANVLRDSAGNVFIVDWDEVMMAPKERDFIFLNEGSFYGLAGDSITPFIQGYGHTEIDWSVLTYYKFERAIQDLIAYTEEVLFKDDSAGMKTKQMHYNHLMNFLKGVGKFLLPIRRKNICTDYMIYSYDAYLRRIRDDVRLAENADVL